MKLTALADSDESFRVFACSVSMSFCRRTGGSRGGCWRRRGLRRPGSWLEGRSSLARLVSDTDVAGEFSPDTSAFPRLARVQQKAASDVSIDQQQGLLPACKCHRSCPRPAMLLAEVEGRGNDATGDDNGAAADAGSGDDTDGGCASGGADFTGRQVCTLTLSLTSGDASAIILVLAVKGTWAVTDVIVAVEEWAKRGLDLSLEALRISSQMTWRHHTRSAASSRAAATQTREPRELPSCRSRERNQALRQRDG
eukprot:716813-Hanusia_phi.AAC.2